MNQPITPTIAIRYPEWSRYWLTVLPGLLDFIQLGRSWQLQTEDNSYGEMESVRIDGSWTGEGMVLFRATEQELQTFRNRGQAVVLTSTEGPDLGFPRVLPDNEAVGRIAAEHLLERGLQHMAFIARGETLYQEEMFAPGKRVYCRERLKGFRDRLEEEGITPKTHLLPGYELWDPDAWKHIRADVRKFLEQLPAPCGLFAVDDALGSVVLRAAADLNLAVPEQLMVVSFGDDPLYCLGQYPSLSSIPYPGRKVGYLAAELLEKQMNGDPCKNTVIRVPVEEVHQRKSSDFLALEDPVVSMAVAWIRKTAPTQPIHVSELSSICHISASALAAKFQHAIGHGPKQEIKQVRLERLKYLLKTTEAPLSELCGIMNFTSAHELSRFFLKETGERPGTWREKQRIPSHRP